MRQTCSICKNNLGARTIMKNLDTCLICRKLIGKLCIKCKTPIKWSQNKCKKCQSEDKSKLFLGSKNPMFNRTVFDIHKEKFGIDVANQMKLEIYKKSINTKNLNGGTSGSKNSMFGKKHTKETKLQMSNSKSGEKNPMFNKNVFDIWIIKYGEEIAQKMWNEKSQKHSEFIRNCKNPMYNNHFTKIWLTKYNENEIREKRKKIFKHTKPEQEFKKYLINNNIKFIQQYVMFDKQKKKVYFYDFYLEDYNMLIEIDGDYWHCRNLSHCPKNYEIIIKNDIAKNELAKNMNYRLIRIWASELDTIWRIF
jgi:very-short-patch-repair endonuclease